MKFRKTTIEGVILIEPEVFNDERGYFMETWQQDRYVQIGIDLPFVQDNHSVSKKGVLRGLHYQYKHPQGKLMSVSVGTIFDVVVDIRPESPTYRKWYGTELSENNHYQLWIPPGLAHGFLTLSERAHCHYKCTDFYYPEFEKVISWDDYKFNIKWPLIEGMEILMSRKDY